MGQQLKKFTLGENFRIINMQVKANTMAMDRITKEMAGSWRRSSDVSNHCQYNLLNLKVFQSLLQKAKLGRNITASRQG